MPVKRFNSEKNFVLEPTWLPTWAQKFAGNRQGVVGVANTVYISPVEIPRPAIISRASIELTAAAPAGTNIRIGIYSDNGNKPDGGNLIIQSNNIPADSLGIKTFVFTNPIKVPAGMVWVAMAVESTSTFLGFVADSAFVQIGDEKLRGCFYTLGAFGNLTNPCPTCTSSADSAFLCAIRVDSFLE